MATKQITCNHFQLVSINKPYSVRLLRHIPSRMFCRVEMMVLDYVHNYVYERYIRNTYLNTLPEVNLIVYCKTGVLTVGVMQGERVLSTGNVVSPQDTFCYIYRKTMK